MAARTRHMDTNTLLDRLSARFDTLPSLDRGIEERHKTIQAAIDWSYDLLDRDEQRLRRSLEDLH